MSAPLLPFLYQTRTLQRLPRASANVRVAVRCLLHTTTSRRREDPIPFELPPDLRKERGLEEPQQPKGRSTITPSERDTFERIFHEIAARGRAPYAPHSRGAEAASQARPGAAVEPEEGEGEAAAEAEAGRRGGDRWQLLDGPPATLTSKGREAINVIIQEAASSSAIRRRRPGVPGLDRLGSLETAASCSADRERALLRFPPSLRRAAQLAMGVIEPAPQWDREPRLEPQGRAEDGAQAPAGGAVSPELLARTAELEALRSKDRARVEKLMRDAETDFQLWQVMEAEVFPMVEKLGFAEPARDGTAAAGPKSNRRRGRKKSADVQAEVAPADYPPAAEAQLSMDVHGPLYPSHLLYGLRLLDSHFATSSPLALSLLPRIKQLGLVSYVLGISTPFFSTLMFTYWHRYSDVGAVLALLGEMRHAGLHFDKNTQAIVDSIDHHLGPFIRGSGGRFLGEVLRMPEYEAAMGPTLDRWKRTVSRSMVERQRDLGY